MTATADEDRARQRSAVRYERDADGIVTLTLDDPTASANTMNELYVASMAAARRPAARRGGAGHRRGRHQRQEDLLRRRRPDPDVAGHPGRRAADLRDVEQVKAGLRRLETLGGPVVAAINGAALGGGLEIALAANHRIAVATAATRSACPR